MVESRLGPSPAVFSSSTRHVPNTMCFCQTLRCPEELTLSPAASRLHRALSNSEITGASCHLHAQATSCSDTRGPGQGSAAQIPCCLLGEESRPAPRMGCPAASSMPTSRPEGGGATPTAAPQSQSLSGAMPQSHSQVSAAIKANSQMSPGRDESVVCVARLSTSSGANRDVCAVGGGPGGRDFGLRSQSCRDCLHSRGAKIRTWASLHETGDHPPGSTKRFWASCEAAHAHRFGKLDTSFRKV